MPAAGRLGDKAQVQGPGCAHGCPACPHPATGPAIMGSADVFINSRPAVRVDDFGMHAVCCGMNMWTAKMGAPTVFINNKAAYRKDDMGQSCGGMTKMIEGSTDVFIGDGAGGGSGGKSMGAAAPKIDEGSKGSGGKGTAGGGTGGQTTGPAGGASSGTSSTQGARPARDVHADNEPPGRRSPSSEALEAPPPEEAWIEVVFTDEEGQPLAGTEYKVELPDGTIVEGKLDDSGKIRREHIEPGVARVWLPDHDPNVPPPPRPPTVPVEETAFFDVVLKDENGRPAAGMKVKLELPDGTVLEETLDDQGRLRKEGIKPGDVKLHLPEEKK